MLAGYLSEFPIYFQRMFTMPSTTIPFAGVNHNKYMVTDNAAFISTSNWSGDYFISTGGVSVVYNETCDGSCNAKTGKSSKIVIQSESNKTMQVQLKELFERDWESDYSIALK